MASPPTTPPSKRARLTASITPPAPRSRPSRVELGLRKDYLIGATARAFADWLQSFTTLVAATSRLRARARVTPPSPSITTTERETDLDSNASTRVLGEHVMDDIAAHEVERLRLESEGEVLVEVGQ